MDAFSTRLGGGHDRSGTAHMVHHTPMLGCAFEGRVLLLGAWEFSESLIFSGFLT